MVEQKASERVAWSGRPDELCSKHIYDKEEGAINKDLFAS